MGRCTRVNRSADGRFGGGGGLEEGANAVACRGAVLGLENQRRRWWQRESSGGSDLKIGGGYGQGREQAREEIHGVGRTVTRSSRVRPLGGPSRRRTARDGGGRIAESFIQQWIDRGRFMTMSEMGINTRRRAAARRSQRSQPSHEGIRVPVLRATASTVPPRSPARRLPPLLRDAIVPRLVEVELFGRVGS